MFIMGTDRCFEFCVVCPFNPADGLSEETRIESITVDVGRGRWIRRRRGCGTFASEGPRENEVRIDAAANDGTEEKEKSGFIRNGKGVDDGWERWERRRRRRRRRRLGR